MMRPSTVVFLVAALLSACGARNSPCPAPGPVIAREIQVGEGASRLTLLPDGVRLIVSNLEDSSLSVVDLAAGTEIRRILFDLVTEEVELIDSTFVDPDGKTVWAASTRGRVLRVDLDTGETEELFLDMDYYFSGILRDVEHNRLILAGEQEEDKEFGFWSLAEGEIESIAHTDLQPYELCRVGSRVHFLACESAIWGEGSSSSALGVLDLKTDEVTEFRHLEEGIAFALRIGPKGDLWVTDLGMDRILRFSPDLTRVVVRSMRDFWEEGGGSPMHLAVDEGRVLVSDGNRVLEYERSGEMLSDLPVREYAVAEIVGDILCLPGGRLIVADYRTGILHVLSADDAKPFSGWN